ncbi:4-hydroxyphenylacetate 3-hydroxylase N-terminal domain-containing protein [Rhodococcus artemisiae]|uniref:4-hydroxyphenylacetate 3-hydroxylase N-terminal domain-containing protein n=1 Tax=Rhodococcus artemisiae TaxID=714159 RepID=A0ABU7LEX0_9NOCA|nr:4-hydroxyphenylacetate 3-hydroxylase N-terminal domain-containing protein [Rhodococcus artemisiae]MEE2060105.1 4-hydroxyphenylacetate 3-hydroxylase N-terminal domain-containing protein [Rhodococcus artemisiae]
MAIRTSDNYRKGLSDGRRVFYRGRTVKDVVSEPELSLAVEHSAICYDIATDRTDLAVTEIDGEAVSTFYVAPSTAEDLVRRGALIEEVSRRGGGTIVLKEVGSDALFALLRATEGEGLDNARAFYDRVCREDLALAVAQTDVKGNRSLGPGEQADPDLYLRIVDEDAESITVRGAKCHTSFSANADELIVLPTRALSSDDADYAVSFAIPIDTPGLNLYVSPYAAGERNRFEFPLSTRHKLLESLTVFDDVRVPKDRVFLNRRPELAGPLALAFVDYHRFTAINYKLPLLDIVVGAASLVAEANGISKAGHVKTKLTELITWSETVRGLAELSAIRSRPGEHGVQQPDPLAVNMAKYHFAHGFHNATAILMDLSGGLLATGPGGDDWDNPEIRPVLEKYYTAAVPAEKRLRILNFIADLTARDYGGYQAVLATHAEGSLEAEKLQISRSFDPTRARDYVGVLAGIDTL